MSTAMSPFTAASQKVEQMLDRLNAARKDVVEAEHDLNRARALVSQAQINFQNAREDFFKAYPDLRPSEEVRADG